MNVAMTTQVADAQKALTSTAKVCDAGNVQVFTKSGGWIIVSNESTNVLQAIEKVARKVEMKRAGGTYTYDTHVKNNEQDRANEQSTNRYRALGSVEEEENARDAPHAAARAQDFTRLGDELI